MDYKKLILSDAIRTAMDAERRLIILYRIIAVMLCIIIVLLWITLS